MLSERELSLFKRLIMRSTMHATLKSMTLAAADPSLRIKLLCRHLTEIRQASMCKFTKKKKKEPPQTQAAFNALAQARKTSTPVLVTTPRSLPATAFVHADIPHPITLSSTFEADGDSTAHAESLSAEEVSDTTNRALSHYHNPQRRHDRASNCLSSPVHSTRVPGASNASASAGREAHTYHEAVHSARLEQQAWSYAA
ncbi:hypothetical protein PYCC9005_001945 [Savitreella phatthalungensis]